MPETNWLQVFLLFFLLIELPRFFIIPVRAMFAAAFAAVATFQMVFFCEYDVAFRTQVIIFRV